MSDHLSERAQLLKPSATLAVTQKAAELRAQGRDIIGLGTGEPDFTTPEPIREAAIAAIKDGHTHYTAVDGIAELKQAIVAKFDRENRLNYEPKNILVSSGAKQSIYNAAQALLNPGDEVILVAPYWVSYPAIVELAEAKNVIVDAGIEQHFKITPQQLEQAITAKTKLFILNSPSNPTGVMYSKEELQALSDVLLKHPHVMILSDDIYEHVNWSGEAFYNILNVCPELAERTVVINGVSKAYAMTGWRIGYAAGPAAVIQAMKKIQSQSTSNPCSIAQYAAVAALHSGTEYVVDMVEAFKRRHDFVVEALNTVPGIQCLSVQAALYAFANVEQAMQAVNCDTDVAFSEYLLEKAGLAVVPGTAFGMNGYIRISIATADVLLHEALSRLKELLQKQVVN